jgi:hypothetical protein
MKFEEAIDLYRRGCDIRIPIHRDEFSIFQYNEGISASSTQVDSSNWEAKFPGGWTSNFIPSKKPEKHTTQVFTIDEKWNILKYWLKDNYNQTNYSVEEKDLLSIIISTMTNIEKR